MDIASITHDADAAEKGRKFAFIQGTSVWLCSMESPAFRNRLRALTEEHSAKLRRGEDLPEAVREAIRIRAIADTILVGWEGFEEKGHEGQMYPIQYSKERAAELLRASPILTDFVVKRASELFLFTKQATEEAKAALGENSAGNGDTPTS